VKESVIDVPPDAARVINSLRDTGYSFETAVADLVDNSIAARASRVVIRVEMDYSGNVHFSIADNGGGMDEETLKDAMRYGSRAPGDPERLGKFGLGLKTASTAFCRLLEVTSRDAPTTVPHCACWDLDRVERENRWALQLRNPGKEAIAYLNQASPNGTGTVVAWRKIDRFFSRNYKDPGGASATRAFEKKVESLRQHLAMTFQRFLEGRAKRYDKLSILVNDVSVEPWDPFASSEPGTDRSEHSIDVEIVRGGKVENIPCVLTIVILPSQPEWSSEAAYRAALVSQDYQGIYVYRHDRLLSHGTWLKIRSAHNSLNMLRVELSFDYRLDDAFSVPVDKSHIELDEAFADYLTRTYLAAPMKAAERKRITAQMKKVARKGQELHKGSNATIGHQAPAVPQPQANIIDATSGEVELTNRTGKVRITLPVRSLPGMKDVFISPTSGLPDGILFRPVLANGESGVELNTSHEYYRKVYLPNQSVGIAIQGMDTLLWALCVSELNNCTPATATTFEEIRYEMSKILRTLVRDLPDPLIELDD
jgi:hypothetical protein